MPADIQTILRLAREFGSLMQEELSTTDFREMLDRNKAEANPTTCHSHDFCDANMVMLHAFQATFDRDPAFLRHDDETGAEDMRLWNDAWAVASAADFFA